MGAERRVGHAIGDDDTKQILRSIALAARLHQVNVGQVERHRAQHVHNIGNVLGNRERAFGLVMAAEAHKLARRRPARRQEVDLVLKRR
jgi:hypothetical protein